MSNQQSLSTKSGHNLKGANAERKRSPRRSRKPRESVRYIYFTTKEVWMWVGMATFIILMLAGFYYKKVAVAERLILGKLISQTSVSQYIATKNTDFKTTKGTFSADALVVAMPGTDIFIERRKSDDHFLCTNIIKPSCLRINKNDAEKIRRQLL